MTTTRKMGHRGKDHRSSGRNLDVPVTTDECNSGSDCDVTTTSGMTASGCADDAPARRQVRRGLTTEVSSSRLRSVIWTRGLSLASRFRVIRTIDIAVACFAEREYKAALTAAQRAVRGMVKASLLRRYRTDRFQTVYGLTQRGAEWLQEGGTEAAASVRRVSDMTNPEHRLWSQFVVLAAEARGLKAWTESELMQAMNSDLQEGKPAVQGLFRVSLQNSGETSARFLRPDALIAEGDGATWVEVDRSARGSERAAYLRALVLSMGARLADGQTLARVVVFTRTERIRRRVVALLAQTELGSRDAALVSGRRQLRESTGDTHEVWLTRERRHRDGRVSLVDQLAGHVIVQRLPVWLPKVRLDGRGTSSTAGWFEENYLPYCRHRDMTSWPSPTSPLFNLPGAVDRVDRIIGMHHGP